MKKILAIILVLCMVLGLAACGKKSESVQGSQEMSSGEAAANVNPTFINWGTRREVEKEGALRTNPGYGVSDGLSGVLNGERKKFT